VAAVRASPNLASGSRARVAGTGGAHAWRGRDCGGGVRVRAAGRRGHRAVVGLRVGGEAP
jgi:hypothetical protein